ncbi:hypothetical protein [Sansalvadorimonas verongulae]|uniref:hypothetical protein n=1 Tax=Sansalvadorimonas verongulae TaxID=2172824 RepID=UPI0012BCF1F0|nr:hypothetical protein [Sansalvadorimonas verongulae]MTI14763.1 hypothetical protein [Sansalvadorimonas verongulae]
MSQAKEQVIDKLIVNLGCQSSDVFSSLKKILHDEEKFYYVFLHLLKNGEDYKALRESFAVPDKENLSVLPHDVAQVYLPLFVTCKVGSKGEEWNMTGSQVAAIARGAGIRGIERVQMVDFPFFGRQVSNPMGVKAFCYPPHVDISLEKYSNQGAQVTKTEVSYHCRARGEIHEFEKQVADQFGRNPQTLAVCQHLISLDTIYNILSRVTREMKYRVDKEVKAGPDDCFTVRLISLDERRMTAMLELQFSKFTKQGGAGKRVKSTTQRGHLSCQMNLLHDSRMWRVQNCCINYEDNVNTAGPVGIDSAKPKVRMKTEAQAWEQSPLWLYSSEEDLTNLKYDDSSQAEPVRRKSKTQAVMVDCLGGNTWLVSSNLEQAKTYRLMDQNLGNTLDVWERQVEIAERAISAAECINSEVVQKTGGIYKSLDLDRDCDMVRTLRQNPDYQREEVERALAYSVARTRARRDNLTRRCEDICEHLLQLEVALPSVDKALFAQDSESLADLEKLLGMYRDSTHWHKERLQELVDFMKVDLTAKTNEEISERLASVKDFEGESKAKLARYRLSSSEGGKLRTTLKIGGGDNSGSEDDKVRVARENGMAHYSKLSFTYSNAFVWYRKKAQHLLEQECVRRAALG